MNYECRGKVFATLAEAIAYAEAIRKATGTIVAVTGTKRKPSHIYCGVRKEA